MTCQKRVSTSISRRISRHITKSAPTKRKSSPSCKKAAAGSEVWLASDEDREGEAIAWHLTHALKLDPAKTKRIVFHEITKTAIDAAIKNPRTVDIKLVDAQQARRVLDRLVGYELSPVLWKKVRTGLSAGRVQSVAVRLIVEREREIRSLRPRARLKSRRYSWPMVRRFRPNYRLNCQMQQAAEKWLQDVVDASLQGQQTSSKNPAAAARAHRLPPAPCSKKPAAAWAISVRQTMTLAQRLYESGHITYMRTDSTILSGLAIAAAENYIKTAYGDKYHQVRQYKTKNSSAQEAHEAIRPTDFSKPAPATTTSKRSSIS